MCISFIIIRVEKNLDLVPWEFFHPTEFLWMKRILDMIMHSVLRIVNGRFRGGAMRAIAPSFKENFSNFFNKNEQKMNLQYLE
jgi:hypothetical protein